MQREEKNISLYEEEFYEPTKAGIITEKLLIFRLKQEWYGIEISSIKEVVKSFQITYLPSSPKDIEGVVNFKGDILLVIDLKKLFRLQKEKITEKSRLIVITSGVYESALLVDEVINITEVPKSMIAPPLTTIPVEYAEYIEGECRADGRLLGILNVKNILDKEIINPDSIPEY